MLHITSQNWIVFLIFEPTSLPTHRSRKLHNCRRFASTPTSYLDPDADEKIRSRRKPLHLRCAWKKMAQ